MTDLSTRPTASDVRAGYLLLLGRPPESEEVVQQHLAACTSIEALRRRFLTSPEFYRNNVRSVAANVVGRGFTLSTADIQWTVPDDARERLFSHIRRAWTSMGKEEPHYSVLSVPDFKPEKFDENRSEFDDSGRAEVVALIRRLESLHLPTTFDSIIELGCGVGRVSRHLLPLCSSFVGIDVSEPHLAIARKALVAQTNTAVCLEELESIDGLDFSAHDFFYSRIVLQHNPPPIALAILEHMFERLRPGGVAAFQTLTALDGYSFSVDEYLQQAEERLEQELHVLPQQAIFAVAAKHGCIPVEVVRDSSVTGFDRISTWFCFSKPPQEPEEKWYAKLLRLLRT